MIVTMSRPVGPLSGIRVLDLSERSLPAAFACLVLADLGADVLHVEPLDGDPVTQLAGAAVWRRGQRRVSVGPSLPASEEWRRALLWADVLLDTAQAWTAKPEGLDRSPLPHHVHCMLTSEPARPGAAEPGDVYGELAEARWGFQHWQDGVREGPIFLGWPHAAHGTASLAVVGVLAGLVERARTGRGRSFTTSLVDGLAIQSLHRLVSGEGLEKLPGQRSTVTRMGNRRHVVSIFECADGWICVHTGARGAFDRLVDVLGRPELKVPVKTATAWFSSELSQEDADEFWEFMRRAFRSRPAAHWLDALAAVDVSVAATLPPGAGLGLEQALANGLVDGIPGQDARVGVYSEFSRTPWRPSRQEAKQVELRELPLVERPIRAGSTRSGGPLEGVLALDFGAWMAGPFCGRVLADLGARVIKLEPPEGDPMRRPLGAFLGVQRGKESVAVDLKTASGRSLAGDLASRADVVMHNMRTGAMERLGLSPEELMARNPRLVYCHSAGYGLRGPLSASPAFEPLSSALTGVLARSGGEGNPPRNYLSNLDFGNGFTSAIAILAALVERSSSGLGQHVVTTQLGTGLLAMADVHYEGGRLIESFPLDGEQRGHAATNALYRTADGWLLIACCSVEEWTKLHVALALGPPSSGYREARSIPLSQSAAARRIASALAGMQRLEACRALRAAGVPCEVPRALDQAEVLHDPNLRRLGVIARELHPEAGEILEVGDCIRFDGWVGSGAQPAPLLGADTERVMAEIGRESA
jgi:crotonobetainyl-CoA:carnitine CoA-transferase CaiB-like acyl-CoA transferase